MCPLPQQAQNLLDNLSTPLSADIYTSLFQRPYPPSFVLVLFLPMQLCESKAGASWTFGKTEEKCFHLFFSPKFSELMQESLVASVKSFQPPEHTHSSCNRAAAAKRSLSHLSVCLTEHGRSTTEPLAPKEERAAVSKQPKPFSPQRFVSLCPHLPTFALPPLVCTQADFKGLEDLKSCFSTPPMATRKLGSKSSARTSFPYWLSR